MFQAEAAWERRRELVARALHDLRPDVLCVNEVGLQEDTGRWLWRRLAADGPQYAYLEQANGGSLPKMGQAILSRFPVVESGVLDYRSRDRLAQVARLKVEDRLVDVYLTHLHHVRREPHIRDLEVERLLAWMARRDVPHARLVCGDFNSEPDSRAIMRMAQDFDRTQDAPTFPTALRYAAYGDHPGEEERTLFLCFDYIWYQAPLVMTEQGRCCDQPATEDGYLWPSDHIGLWADFELPALR
jgi:endonuclease/exonuclease/phosphatase family metal-dependent hydrolase